MSDTNVPTGYAGDEERWEKLRGRPRASTGRIHKITRVPCAKVVRFRGVNCTRESTAFDAIDARRFSFHGDVNALAIVLFVYKRKSTTLHAVYLTASAAAPTAHGVINADKASARCQTVDSTPAEAIFEDSCLFSLVVSPFPVLYLPCRLLTRDVHMDHLFPNE